jgi:hypothetical protein
MSWPHLISTATHVSLPRAVALAAAERCDDAAAYLLPHGWPLQAISVVRAAGFRHHDLFDMPKQAGKHSKYRAAATNDPPRSEG